ncbi:transposase [Streptococcus pyogenes]|nr:transposase [Streptococcus pyogenes]VGQ16113.1 transposase [Streptococcus pyogenes]VGQ45709.1 transposase [Streptococcus pyogenes]VGQ46414.1 transposase [Streptococcus pyogenes]VGQ78458.1 transposase [Streptococcus pyogenes]
MTQFTTELLNFLAQKQDIDEFFRSSLEIAMNDLLQVELSAFLGYEPYEKKVATQVIAVMGLILVSLKQSMA